MKRIALLLLSLQGIFALITGGKECSKNVQCGIPAANLEQSRDVTDSLSGQCLYFVFLRSTNVEKERAVAMMDLVVQTAVQDW